jgi:hypothetical protein
VIELGAGSLRCADVALLGTNWWPGGETTAHALVEPIFMPSDAGHTVKLSWLLASLDHSEEHYHLRAWK